MKAKYNSREYLEDGSYRKKAIQAAKDLMYDASVVRRIKQAKSDIEISNIMVQARKNIEDRA